MSNQYAYQNANRTKWSCDLWNSVTLAWSNGAATIYAPNQNFSQDYISSQMKFVLANGSNGYVNTESGYRREPLTFQWLELLPTDSFITLIEGWVQTNQIVRINSASGVQYVGSFIKCSRVFLTDDVCYDLQAIFERSQG